MGQNNKQRKLELFSISPNCYWCNRITVLFEQKLGKPGPSNMATVDHIIPKYKITLPGQYNSKENTVLSCNKCNQDRNNYERVNGFIPPYARLFIPYGETNKSKTPILIS